MPKSPRNSTELPRTTGKPKADDPEATQPIPPPWEPAGQDTLHRHDGGRAELHPLGDQPHTHAPGGTVVFPAADTTQPVWTPPQPGSYAPPDDQGHHAHDGERELHAEGDRPHYHDPGSGILVFLDPDASPAPAPARSWFGDRVSSSTGQQADPTPAAPTTDGDADASAESQPRDGDGTAGAGRLIHETCTDCGKAVTWREGGDDWRHDDGTPAYGLDGHIVHSDKLPANRAYTGNGQPRELERHNGVSATSRSIGHVVAGNATETVLGTPDHLADEKTHMRFVVEIALECGAEDHRHGRVADATRLLDLEAAVLHMVHARGLKQ
jgi:hypothetical protein